MISMRTVIWPGLIFVLLGLSIVACSALIYFSQSDGGARVVPDYYQQSVDYDDWRSDRLAAIELGWTVDIVVDGQGGVVTVVDDGDRPVDGAEGSLTFRRIDRAKPTATVPIESAKGMPGEYVFDGGTDEPGVWEIEIELVRADDHWIDTIRKSVDS